MKTDTRNVTIAYLRKSGNTLAEIGRAYGISRQRVGQIIDKVAPQLNTHHIRKPDVVLTCMQCGDDFKVRPHRGTVEGKYAKAKYCSMACSTLAVTKYPTETEKRDRRNSLRRTRYHTDPAYRRHIIDMTMSWHRKKVRLASRYK